MITTQLIRLVIYSTKCYMNEIKKTEAEYYTSSFRIKPTILEVSYWTGYTVKLKTLSIAKSFIAQW